MKVRQPKKQQLSLSAILYLFTLTLLGTSATAVQAKVNFNSLISSKDSFSSRKAESVQIIADIYMHNPRDSNDRLNIKRAKKHHKQHGDDFGGVDEFDDFEF